ncbi:MAG: 2-C-methyl-D-erythritol 4-phosphate cytidylyltransferase [Gemmatimonadaceae bacterium]|nr:2-C-methyl-D-erythritol 4-phosphate cytidylyltransferase [Gemmatimonadaceae bacterium]NUO94177.1 2-C-methyl-D-erythritol 4-phosphate cytidylyltransferase [Gemmatimonadaceae bacterium]NUP72837.1 2-C-methyl-D-erythritol 4-phosphate cytidylyltransferase [Gemmatimonadaceae bacterium]
MTGSFAPPRRDVGVVIVAGGSGTRVGGGELKQFRWVAGKPMLLHSVQTFMARPDVGTVVVVLPSQYAGDPPPWLFQCDVDRLLVSLGGRTRSESVANGLDDLPDEAEVVLVHDAARPLVGAATIDRVVSAVRAGRSVIAALPVVDTLKQVDDDGRIVATVPRDNLWRAQTPQGFPRRVIVDAHRRARADRIEATDDAALLERLGIAVEVVRGSERALKVTDVGDFARVDALLASDE